MNLNTLHKALKKGPLTDNQVRGLFNSLDENGWQWLVWYFDEEDRDYITEIFCREIGVKDEPG